MPYTHKHFNVQVTLQLLSGSRSSVLWKSRVCAVVPPPKTPASSSLLPPCWASAFPELWCSSESSPSPPIPPNLLTWQKISFSLASTSRLASWTSSAKGLLSSKAHCFKVGTVDGERFWRTEQEWMHRGLAPLVISICVAVMLSPCYTSHNAQRFCTSNECLCGSQWAGWRNWYRLIWGGVARSFHTHLSPGLHMALQVILLVHGWSGNRNAQVEWRNGKIVCVFRQQCLLTPAWSVD